MEYNWERAGGFEPLRFVPKHKTVVLGLVTSKFGTLESKDALKRRIDEAAKYMRSTSFACRRNAALPPPRRATFGRGRAVGEAPARSWVGRRSLAIKYPYRDRTGSNPTHQAALPGRPCRQPAPSGGAEGCARQARARRDRCRSAARDRGPRDQAADRPAGGDRPESRSPTANIAAPSGRPIFCGARRHRDLPRRPQDPVQGRLQPSNGSRG